jgi:hypothetical protein
VFTALVIAVLIVAGAATAVGGVLVWASGRKQLGPGASAVPRLTAGTDERGLGDLRLGDVVQHQGRDYLVEGLLTYDEDGHDWTAGRLVDGDDERWLVVGMERIGAAALRLCEVDRQVEMSGYPPEFLTVGGDRYKLDKRGTASVKATGDAAVVGGKDPAAGGVLRCRWWRYEAPGERCMLVEQWGGEFRVLRGATVAASDLDLMPGS